MVRRRPASLRLRLPRQRLRASQAPRSPRARNCLWTSRARPSGAQPLLRSAPGFPPVPGTAPQGMLLRHGAVLRQ
eukprot:10624520-Lingulodinium_polyedra.AAC.1